MRTILLAAALTGVLVAVPQSQAADQTPAVNAIERPFVSDGRLRMELSAGEYRVIGSSDNRIRLEWRVGDKTRLSEVRTRADVRGAEGTITTDAPGDSNLKETIHVPSRSDLVIRLSAGELTVEGIQGNKDIRLHAGELRIGVRRPEEYQRIRASVWVGDLNVEPFNVRKGGFFRSFDWSGHGSYRLRARLKAGDLLLYAAP
jgi:hypothetical protein